MIHFNGFLDNQSYGRVWWGYCYCGNGNIDRTQAAAYFRRITHFRSPHELTTRSARKSVKVPSFNVTVNKIPNCKSSYPRRISLISSQTHRSLILKTCYARLNYLAFSRARSCMVVGWKLKVTHDRCSEALINSLSYIFTSSQADVRICFRGRAIQCRRGQLIERILMVYGRSGLIICDLRLPNIGVVMIA